MAGSSLYDIVQGKKSSNKRRVGYTVSAYAGVLSALKNANSTNSNNQSSSNSLLSGDEPQETVVSHSYSFLGTHSGETVFNKEGFSLTEGLNQIMVKLSTFMACPVIVNIDGKSYSEIATNNEIIDVENDGKCLVDGRYFFSNEIDKDTHVIDSTGYWCVGAGVPMVQTAMSYFNHFYNKIKCFNDSKKGILEKIAGEGLLYVEVMLPMGNNEYNVVHCKVIHDVKNATNTSNFMVYMPIPLLMLDDYKGIGDIIVSYSNIDMSKPNHEEVNKDNVKFEFRNKNFNHKEAKIEGFTVDAIGKHYFSNNNDVAVDFEQWKRKSQFGSARFYFSDQDKERIREILEEEIPEEYQESLFRGVLTEDKVYRTLNTTISSPPAGGGNLTEACKYMAQLIHNVLTPKQVERAEAQVASFEGGGRWDAWNPQDKNEGASIGRHQMSSRAGNVLEYLNVYKSMGGEVSSGFMYEATAASKVKGRVDGSKMLPYKTEFERQAATVIGQNAQLRVFFNGVKGKNTARWFNELKCTTALELSSIMGAVNHWPYGMDAAFSAYKDDILKAETVNKKAEYIERCHMAANYAAVTKGIKKSTFTVPVFKTIKFKTLSTSDSNLSTWKGRHEKMINFAKDGKFDM